MQIIETTYADYAAILERSADLITASRIVANRKRFGLQVDHQLPVPPRERPERSRKRPDRSQKRSARSVDPSPSHDSPGSIARGRQGGLPAEIAARVEAVDLQVDDLKVTLRAYQEFGIKYLVRQRRTILGDEMGLGKTIQALGAMLHVAKRENATQTLIVAPASILGNWQREIKNRLPSHKVRLMHGDARDQNTYKWLSMGGVALTSFATLRLIEGHATFAPDYLIVDEAHYVKNPEAQRSQAIENIARNSARTVLMSGTPLENHVDEFINLIRICDPALAALTRTTGRKRIAPAVFEKMVALVYLRRNQDDVLKELPELMETEEWIELTEADWKLYDQNINDGIMKLRQVANRTAINSAKIKRLKELVDDYREKKRKVVVFSFFKDSLTLAGQAVGPHHRIDGSVSPQRRLQILDEFSASNESQVLVAQIEAGGIGLNMQAASVVILMEPQFKPTTEWQAIKRVHRMGQPDRVRVHRLIASDTVDERLHELVGVKTADFNDYARESAIKNASPEASDASDKVLRQKILALELERFRHRQSAGSCR